MAPLTITEVLNSPSHSTIETEEQKCYERLKTNYEKHKTFDPYDESRPKNEHKFLAPIRELEKEMGFVTALRWKNIIFISLFHIVSVIWLLTSILFRIFPKWETVVFSYLVGKAAGFGVTAGAHRYWSHRSYKATKPLQIILMICYSIAGQNTIFNWVRDHRVHHKFSETSADPHDARRGFFFSHVGWLMMKKHPDVKREGAKMDMSDIENDSIVKFHTKYFGLFKLAFCFVVPSMVPIFMWKETWGYTIMSQIFVRYMLSLNFTWSVNSFAHLWGNRPYDRHIMPTENWGVSVVAMGEGWHNYHHTFPWDYKAAELAYTLNLTTLILDFFSAIGWAYDMKEASPSLIAAVIKNRGQQCRKNT